MYDGSRWLGELRDLPFQIYAGGTPPFSVVGQNIYIAPLAGSIYVVSCGAVVTVNTTNGASNYWAYGLYVDNTLGWNSTTAILSADVPTLAMNDAWNTIYNPVTYLRWRVNSKVGSPGSVYINPSLSYRRIYT
jgi:hypothetical protein